MFLEVKSLNKQFTLMLDRAQTPSLEDFMRYACQRINLPYLSRVHLLYLPPNHQLMDLEPIEKDDLVTLGTRADV